MGRFEDLTGQKFDRLMVIERAPSEKGVLWRCACDCGSEKEVIVKTADLKSGAKRSCGCLLDEWRASKHSDIIGKKYGMLTVLEQTRKVGRKLYFKCQCDCGNALEVRKDGLTTGHSKSCGCVREQWMQSGNLNKKHGLYEDRAYWVWAKIKSRCYNPNARQYENYGGRGIRMCDEWQDPQKFVEWCYQTGYDKLAPKGECTIDRIDVNGNYEPSNCRWATALEQANNKRNTVRYKYNEKSMTIAEWSSELKIPYATLYTGLVRQGKPISHFINDYVPRK